jgi:hypothetical protein
VSEFSADMFHICPVQSDGIDRGLFVRKSTFTGATARKRKRLKLDPVMRDGIPQSGGGGGTQTQNKTNKKKTGTGNYYPQK